MILKTSIPWNIFAVEVSGENSTCPPDRQGNTSAASVALALAEEFIERE